MSRSILLVTWLVGIATAAIAVRSISLATHGAPLPGSAAGSASNGGSGAASSTQAAGGSGAAEVGGAGSATGAGATAAGPTAPVAPRGHADSGGSIEELLPWFELPPPTTPTGTIDVGWLLGAMMDVRALHAAGRVKWLEPWKRRVFGSGLLILWLGLPAHALYLLAMRSAGKLTPQAAALGELDNLATQGQFQEVMQKGKRTLADFTGALSPEEEFKVRLLMGRATLRMGMSFEALEIFGRLLERAPTDLEIQGGLVQTYAALGREVPRPRMQVLLSYIERGGPHDPKILDYAVDQILKAKDRTSSAERLGDLMKAWGWQSPSTLALLGALDRQSRGPAHRAAALTVLGKAEIARGNHSLATDHLLGAVDSDPSSRDAHALLATAARAANRIPDVRRAYEEIQGRSEEPALADAIENLDKA